MFTLYQRWDAESQLTPEKFQYILTPSRALEEACRYYDLDRDNYKGRSTHPLPNRLSRSGSPYQRPPRHYADEIHDRLEQELEFGWTIGVVTFSRWDRLDNPFSFNDDGELVFESSGYTHPWFELHVRRMYENVLANSPGGKPVATVKNHSGVAAGNTLNSKGVGRLLAAGGVYNGNVEGFRQAAQDLGGEAIDGYNQVLNETSKGAAIAVASVAAGLGMGRIGLASAVDELEHFGARGASSSRDFDPDLAGGPLKELTTDGVTITHDGIATVEKHVSRFDPDPANEFMVERLRKIANDELSPEQADLNYYTHECREYERYCNLGWESGEPAGIEGYDLWNNAHTATLEEYKLTDNDLFHPDATK